jgi:hypothetical protein
VPAGRVAEQLLGLLVNGPLTRALGATAPDEGVLPDPPLFRPHVRDRRYGFSHYNVVIPALPEPHRFLACCVMIGQSGTRAFDTDHARVPGPGRTATLAFGTAATAPSWFDSYSASHDCELAGDGSVLRFGGGDLTLKGLFPSFELTASRPGFEAALSLEATDEVTWFARSPVYDHLGLPARYAGTISFAGAVAEVAGVASYEYARAVNIRSVIRRTLPWDFFTYHVVELDPDTLLLLTHTRALGRPLLTTAFVKSPGGEQRRIVSGISLELGPSEDPPRTAPDGVETSIPESFFWTRDSDGGPAFELEAIPDTEMIYGVGSGWIGGLRYRGEFDGRQIDARGYFEYVDRRL